MRIINAAGLMLVLLLSGCAGLFERFQDRARPWEVVKKAGGQYLVLFRFRPEAKGVESVHLVGTFNAWSCPGNEKGGQIIELAYNKETRYWERRIILGPGNYHYMYLLNGRSTVVDEKSAETLPNGSVVSRILLHR